MLRAYREARERAAGWGWAGRATVVRSTVVRSRELWCSAQPRMTVADDAGRSGPSVSQVVSCAAHARQAGRSGYGRASLTGAWQVGHTSSARSEGGAGPPRVLRRHREQEEGPAVRAVQHGFDRHARRPRADPDVERVAVAAGAALTESQDADGFHGRLPSLSRTSRLGPARRGSHGTAASPGDRGGDGRLGVAPTDTRRLSRRWSRGEPARVGAGGRRAGCRDRARARRHRRRTRGPGPVRAGSGTP